jgi:hypothetical protein
MKKTLLLNCLLFSLSVLKTEVSNAQMVGADAYMKGNYVELGISGLGGFEGDSISSVPPAGMHYRSSTGFFGFVANPQLNFWATYDGDFFTPGTPENGWGIEIDSSAGIHSKGNNCAYLNEIPGAITTWSYASSLIICDWEGDYTTATDLHLKIDYQLQDTALFYITTVSITNSTAAPVTDLYYYRNLDPDNNEEISGDFTTTNTIVDQISTGTVTQVQATSIVPATQPMSYFSFLAIDSGWVAGYGGFSNRDASDMYNGVGFTQTIGATSLADEAIYIAYKIPPLAPGITHTFKFASIFGSSAVGAAATALNLSTTSTHDLGNIENTVRVYPNPFADYTTISIGKSVDLSNAEIYIFDVVGKEVKSISNIQSHEFTIDRSTLSNGMYFYKLINKGQKIGSGKLIIK